MSRSVALAEYFQLMQRLTVIDVRSEGEFAQGHIPGAVNIPVMNDEERRIIGTVYKQHGRGQAVMKGLELTGPHLKDRLKAAKKHVTDNQALVHCWRGGMRSGFYAYLMEFYGYEPIGLKGGYKAFRTWALAKPGEPLRLQVLGGMTGSGKTEVLHALRERGEQVIDLEALANHRGSSFGNIGLGPQPTQEQFENDLAMILRDLDPARRVWVEDESRTIGNKVIPAGLWDQMKAATAVVLDIPFEARLAYIVDTYGKLPLDDLTAATARIAKRLGPVGVKQALEHLQNGRLTEGLAPSLRYYDKTYGFMIGNRGEALIRRLPVHQVDPAYVADQLLAE
jgi:tRNA 2-selenouridine synthase